MTITEIETYLALKHSSLDDSIGEEIEQLRKDAISQQNEERANYCWVSVKPPHNLRSNAVA